MRKRIFVALPISLFLQDEIMEWEKRYPKLPVRWLAGKNLHITLIPPWYEEEVEKVKETLRQAKGKHFEMRFTKVAYGPDPRTPCLIWVEGEAPKEASALKAELEYIMHTRPQFPKFKMHITLARFQGEDISKYGGKEFDEKVDWRDRATEFVLMESLGGADYAILESFPLSSR